MTKSRLMWAIAAPYIPVLLDPENMEEVELAHTKVQEVTGHSWLEVLLAVDAVYQEYNPRGVRH